MVAKGRDGSLEFNVSLPRSRRGLGPRQNVFQFTIGLIPEKRLRITASRVRDVKQAVQAPIISVMGTRISRSYSGGRPAVHETMLSFRHYLTFLVRE